MASVTRNPRPLFVTALPAGYDGQEVFYRADSSNGVIWHLRARSVANGGSATYPWEFVGGGALYSQTAANANASFAGFTVFGGMSGADPSITLALAGEYLITHRFTGEASASVSIVVGLKVGSVEATSADQTSMAVRSASVVVSVESTDVRSVSAGLAVSQRYAQTSGSSVTIYREKGSLSITPIRVG